MDGNLRSIGPESHAYHRLRLRGGFVIVRLEFVTEPLVDALGRLALAKTQIVGRVLHLVVPSAPKSEKEQSVILYHEVLEAVTVASSNAPSSVSEFNEGDFGSVPPRPRA